jgi:hypothetical protein
VISKGDGDHARAFYRAEPRLPTGNACMRDMRNGTRDTDLGKRTGPIGTKFKNSGMEPDTGYEIRNTGPRTPGEGAGLGCDLRPPA